MTPNSNTTRSRSSRDSAAAVSFFFSAAWKASTASVGMRAPCDHAGPMQKNNAAAMAAAMPGLRARARIAVRLVTLRPRRDGRAGADGRSEHRHAIRVDRFDDEYVAHVETVDRALVGLDRDLRFGIAAH